MNYILHTHKDFTYIFNLMVQFQILWRKTVVREVNVI